MLPKLALVFMFALMQSAGCSNLTADEQPTSQQVQEQKAQEASRSVEFTDNAEIKNIQHRLKLTSQPGLLGYVLLFNPGTGDPAMYTTVEGKITSGGKRLNPTEKLVRCDKGQYYGECNMPSANDEGTYGTSGEYIYFWTTDGQYIQWNGNYLYSDKPIRIPPNRVLVNMVETQLSNRKK